MISSTITIACAVAALAFTRFTHKPLTRYITVFLAISSVLYLDRFIGIAPFGYLIYAFASILASVEPNNSLNLKVHHKTFFVAMGVVIVLMAAANFLEFDRFIPAYILGFLYCLILGLFLFKDKKKKLKSRYGILVVWLATALKWIATLF
mgnify:CR=1 FL=1